MAIEHDIRKQVLQLRRQRAATQRSLDWNREEVSRIRAELAELDNRCIEWGALAADRGIDLSDYDEAGEPVKKVKTNEFD